MKRLKYSKDQISEIVKGSFSIAECLRKLNVRPVGGNYKWLKRLLKHYEIETKHFTGQLWNKGKRPGFCSRTLPLDQVLIENSPLASSNSLRKRLIREGLKEAKCEDCSNSEWRGQPITLELEHCNGINTDNRLENLKILCPNCHAQTPFWRGKNKLSSKSERIKLNRVKFGEPLTGNPEPSQRKLEGVETLRRGPKAKFFCECGTEIDRASKRCRQCDYLNRKDSVRPSVFQLLEDFKQLKSFLQVGKKYSVSDNAVRKWCKLYKLDLDMVKRKSSAQTT